MVTGLRSQLSALRRAMSTDLLASVVVFLVALPLCMGISIASGVPPALGIITGIVGGLVVGLLAGSPLQVSGPAAGLAVLAWQIVQQHGIAALGVMVLLAGVFQLAAGLLRIGQWFRAVSPAVIQGMLAGIGVLILAGQFHVMVDDKPRNSGLANLVSIPEAIAKGLVIQEGSSHHIAALVGLCTLITIVLWVLLRPKKVSFIPEALVGVVVGSVLAALLGAPIQYISVPANLLDAVTVPSEDAFRRLAEPAIFGGALMLAFIASAETLLCATATDRLGGTRTNYDRELAAQGVGNLLCGLLGALPMTGVIVRSSANVNAGAKTRLSAILHGAWLLVFVAALPFVLSHVPMTCLAAILVYTGFKLVNPKAIRELRRYGWTEVLIYAGTLVTVVAVDLLVGVLTGLGLAVAKFVHAASHLGIEVETDGDRVIRIRLRGAATFMRLPKLAAALEAVPAGREVHILIRELAHIDHACLDLLADWEKQFNATGGLAVIEWREMPVAFRLGSGSGAR
jgi:MFS superfamily sulfate permease-like transporter